MSIVGTRPPLPNEWEAYELHHRARAVCTMNEGCLSSDGNVIRYV